MVNSRQKGARGERGWRDYLRERFGLTGARRRQQYSGTEGSDDVEDTIPETFCEVKRVESLNIHKAVTKAVEQCGNLIPYIAHRKNRTEWLVTIRARDLRRFAEVFLDAIENAKDNRRE